MPLPPCSPPFRLVKTALLLESTALVSPAHCQCNPAPLSPAWELPSPRLRVFHNHPVMVISFWLFFPLWASLESVCPGGDTVLAPYRLLPVQDPGACEVLLPRSEPRLETECCFVLYVSLETDGYLMPTTTPLFARPKKLVFVNLGIKVLQNSWLGLSRLLV